METNEYNIITEQPGQLASSVQLERLYHRYRFAAQYIENKDVLEIGCGSGLGLEYMAERAGKLVAGDIDFKNICCAGKACSDKKSPSPCILDAHSLPFADGSFDIVLLYEAIYYLADPAAFLSEAERVLRNKGMLIICTVNKDIPGFHESAFSINYFSVPELSDLLKSSFSNVEIYGAFNAADNGALGRSILFLKKTALAMNLIPKSLGARAYIKRLFFGPLKRIPEKITDDMTDYKFPVEIDSECINCDFQIIYCIARKNGD